MRSIPSVNSSQDEAILHGCKAIGQFVGLTERQVFYRTSTGTLPHFKLGNTTCALRPTLRAWMAAQEAGTAGGAHHG